MWLVVYVASLLVLMGSQRGSLGVVGLSLLLLAFGIAVHLAVGREDGVPRPPGVGWALGGLGLFYVVAALAAAHLGTAYAVAALLAGLVPSTALALTIALTRRKTRERDGHLVDVSAEDASPFAGFGADDATPLGDSPEVHDEIVPEDLPKGHPGRREAERQAARRGGVTRGTG